MTTQQHPDPDKRRRILDCLGVSRDAATEALLEANDVLSIVAVWRNCIELRNTSFDVDKMQERVEGYCNHIQMLTSRILSRCQKAAELDTDWDRHDAAKRIAATESLLEDLPEGTVPLFVAPSEEKYDQPLGPIPGKEYVTRIFTPFKFKDGDHITLRHMINGDLSDEGHTFMRCGVPLLRELPKIRKFPLLPIFDQYGIVENNGVLTMPRFDGWTPKQNVEQFCKAILRIAELLEDEQ